MQYLCHACAAVAGTLRPIDKSTLVDNPYKLGKYIKHTMPTSRAGTVTVFDAPSSANYQDYIVTAVASGFLEVDAAGRTNIIWVGSYQTGVQWCGGKFVGPTHGVKVVLFNDANKVHAYPPDTSRLPVAICARCGAAIPA